MELPGFVGPSYVSQAVTFDQEELMNWYVEVAEVPGSTSKMWLAPTPGVTEIASVSGGSGRAHLAVGSLEFAVIGDQFVQIDIAGNITNRGTVVNDGLPATLSDSGNPNFEIFITSGRNGYIYNYATTVFTQIAALNGKATKGGYLEGYFISLDPFTASLYASELADGLTWNTGTSFAQRSLAADPWISFVISNRYIYLLGTETSEPWFNAGTSPFPFTPDPSGFFEFGCAATFSATVVDSAPVWLGRSKDGRGMVIRANGFNPEIISTYPIQALLNGLTTEGNFIISDAIGFTYNDAGHTFYILSFNTFDLTLAWDSSNPNVANGWAKRGTWLSEENRFGIWRPCFHAFVFGRHRMLDIGTGSIYVMDRAFGMDADGHEIRRVRRAPALVNELQRITYPAFELDLEPGLGNTVDPGSNPQVMMRMSNDGGKTWGNERVRSAGMIGQYGTRVRWNRCGQARRRVFEVSVTDPVPWRLTAAFLQDATAKG
jgi:hypothetical protein